MSATLEQLYQDCSTFLNDSSNSQVKEPFTARKHTSLGRTDYEHGNVT